MFNYALIVAGTDDEAVWREFVDELAAGSAGHGRDGGWGVDGDGFDDACATGYHAG